MSTVRELITALNAVAAAYDMDDSAEIRLAVCDGETMQFIENVDLDVWSRLTDTGAQVESFVVLRGHPHLGETTMRTPVADADEHLRRWTDSGVILVARTDCRC